MNKKTIAIIVAVLVIAAGLVALYFYKVPQQSTASWKTYTNKEYGYHVEYPATWFVDVCGSSDGVSVENFFDVCISAKSPSEDKIAADESFQIIVQKALYPSIDEELHSEFYSGAEATVGEGAGSIGTLEKMKIDGADAARFTLTCAEGAGCQTPQIIILKNGNLYRIFFGLDYEKNKQTFDKILSTFKFDK